jgi:hypothetical protein
MLNCIPVPVPIQCFFTHLINEENIGGLEEQLEW